MRNRPILALSEDEMAEARSLLIAQSNTHLAFNKPAGLPSDARDPLRASLDRLMWAFARSNGKRPRLVHRLDAPTSGIILAARTKPAAAALSHAFEARRVRKRYLAIVTIQQPNAQSGEIPHALRRVSIDGVERAAVCDAASAGAKPAVTQWRRLAESGNRQLIEARPLTGRYHQIRAHLASIGLPIVGDRLYGTDDEAPRAMLHSRDIYIPETEMTPAIHESAPIPDDFLECAEAAGLDVSLEAG